MLSKLGLRTRGRRLHRVQDGRRRQEDRQGQGDTRGRRHRRRPPHSSPAPRSGRRPWRPRLGSPAPALVVMAGFWLLRWRRLPALAGHGSGRFRHSGVGRVDRHRDAARPAPRPAVTSGRAPADSRGSSPPTPPSPVSTPQHTSTGSRGTCHGPWPSGCPTSGRDRYRAQGVELPAVPYVYGWGYGMGYSHGYSSFSEQLQPAPSPRPARPMRPRSRAAAAAVAASPVVGVAAAVADPGEGWWRWPRCATGRRRYSLADGRNP